MYCLKSHAALMGSLKGVNKKQASVYNITWCFSILRSQKLVDHGKWLTSGIKNYKTVCAEVLTGFIGVNCNCMLQEILPNCSRTRLFLSTKRLSLPHSTTGYATPPVMANEPPLFPFPSVRGGVVLNNTERKPGDWPARVKIWRRAS